MSDWLAVMTLISTAILLVLWIWDRMLFAQKLQVLAGQQLETSRTLHEFIDESGKIAQEFTRLLPRQESRSTEPKKRGAEKRRMVVQLAEKGLSTEKISEQVKLPAGEIDLIVNLNQSGTKQVPA